LDFKFIGTLEIICKDGAKDIGWFAMRINQLSNKSRAASNGEQEQNCPI
jgi:hypothetical protein